MILLWNCVFGWLFLIEMLKIFHKQSFSSFSLSKTISINQMTDSLSFVNKPESEFSPRTRAKSTYFDFNTLILIYFDNSSIIQDYNYEKLSKLWKLSKAIKIMKELSKLWKSYQNYEKAIKTIKKLSKLWKAIKFMNSYQKQDNSIYFTKSEKYIT